MTAWPTMLFAALWLGALGGLAWVRRFHPTAATVARLDIAVGRVVDRESVAGSAFRHRWAAATERLGRAVRVHILRRPAAVDLDRRVGRAILAALAAAPVDVRLALIVALISWIQPIRAQRQAVRERHHAVLQELPEVVDLLSVAVRGGLTVPLAVAAVGERLDGEVAAALHSCVEEAALGQRLSERLEQVPAQLGDAIRPLIRALVAADRYGVPIGDPLERVAADVRTARRRGAEVAARRVPIKLLFPLVFCVLPSFALLTVAPVLASSLDSLRL